MLGLLKISINYAHLDFGKWKPLDLSMGYSKFEININLLSANDLKNIEEIIESNDSGWYIIGDMLRYYNEIKDIQKYVFENIEILIEEYEFIK